MLAFTERENHSIRKTCISRLLDADVPENFVAQLSGHKNTKSLQSYKSASAKYQRRMSLTLSRANLSGSRDETLSNLIMSCDVFGTRQTKILTLCYLFEKTYKPAQSSATLESLKSTPDYWRSYWHEPHTHSTEGFDRVSAKFEFR